MNVVYQITVSLGDGMDQEWVAASTQFYKELSERVQHYAGVFVLKEAHVADEVLRDQYADGIAKINQFRKKFDPDRLFNSALWERLLPTPTL